MNFRQFPSSVLFAAWLSFAPIPAFAWGAEGHEVAAAIALGELTPAARLGVARLLGSDVMMVQQSNWADEIKDQRRDTARWHFVDIPLHAAGFVPGRDCGTHSPHPGRTLNGIPSFYARHRAKSGGSRCFAKLKECSKDGRVGQ